MRRPFSKQHGKRAQALFKSSSQQLHHVHWWLLFKLSWKKSLFLTCRILGLLVNTLPADEKYPVLNRGNLTIPIQMQLSKKQKTFYDFFAAFLKSRLNFKCFGKKDDPHRFSIFEITHSENVAWEMSKKSCFRGHFGKQHGKRSQAVLKSALQHLYHIYWSRPS